MMSNSDNSPLREEILGDIEKQLELQQKQKSKTQWVLIKPVLGLCLILFVAYAGLFISGRMRFETVFYQISSPKTEERIRLVCLTDLHNWTFGKDNNDLVSRIDGLAPDLILIAGDMVTSGNDDISSLISLCGRLTNIAPVYYSFGNHENEMVYGEDLAPSFLEKYDDELFSENEEIADFEMIPMADSRLPDALTGEGVILLNNKIDSIQVKDCQIDLAGLNMQSGAYYQYSSKMIEDFLSNKKENLKIIIGHRPSLYDAIATQHWLQYDLLFSGHTHGGIVRLPKIGGIVSPEGNGPWNGNSDSGLFNTNQGDVFLGRGLGNSNPVPRICNTPELAVIDID